MGLWRFETLFRGVILRLGDASHIQTEKSPLRLLIAQKYRLAVLVASLYDRLQGMIIGLVTTGDLIARHATENTMENNPYLQIWVTSVLRLHHKLQDAPNHLGVGSQEQYDWMAKAVSDTWGNRPRTNMERIVALVVGVFCWCDRGDILAMWREALGADCSAETRMGMDVFLVVLRSFLCEPPGRTVWLPLKRKTTIAALKEFSPQVLAELQLTKYSTSPQKGELFLTSTAIACQLPWYSSACKLARRQAQASDLIAIIGSLLGAAFGSIAFQEDLRTIKRVEANQQAVAIAIEPLWATLIGSGNSGSLATVSLANVS